MKKCLGHLLRVGMTLMLCAPLTAFAAELSIKSDTVIRAFNRDTSTESDATVLPAYEYLQVDIENPDAPGLSFHLYGWGRTDLGDSGYFEDTTASELLYGYLEYTREEARFSARLGRQYVFEGVANDSIDGLRLSSDLGRYFSGSVYAGQQVALADENGRSGDSIYGFRLANHLRGRYDLGISYKKIRNDSTDAEERAGLDLSAYLPYNINLYGNSVYNLISEDWAEHSYELSAAIGPVSVRPYFQMYQYNDYFNTKINRLTSLNRFTDYTRGDEELTVIGTDLTLPVGRNWVLVGKGKNYNHKNPDDKERDGSSQYLGAQATWSGEERGQIGAELGFMKGDRDKDKYNLVRVFTYWDELTDILPLSFISADLIYASYDQPLKFAKNNHDSSLFASLGAGKAFMDEALELKLTGDYSKDPYFDSDLRGMLTVSYKFVK